MSSIDDDHGVDEPEDFSDSSYHSNLFKETDPFPTSLTLFFREFDNNKKHAPVSREQEIENAKNNDREALINHNLRWAVKMAKKYQGRGVELDDLVEEAAVGLIKAVDRYDHKKGTVTTLATFSIRDELAESVRNSFDLNFPDTEYKNYLRCLRAKEILTKGDAENGEERHFVTNRDLAHYTNRLYVIPKLKKEGIEDPTERQIDERIERAKKHSDEKKCIIDEDDVKTYFIAGENTKMTSLSQGMGDDESGDYKKIDVSDPAEATQAALGANYTLEAFGAFLDAGILSEREYAVVDLHYGLGLLDPDKHDDDSTFQDIAEALNITPRQVQYAHESAIIKIKAFVEEHNIHKDDLNHRNAMENHPLNFE